MSDRVPFLGDFLEQVLLTQPLKQLARLKTVNKQWRAIISDPKFAKAVLEKEGSNGFHPSRSIFMVCNSESYLGAIDLKKLVRQGTKQDFVTLKFPQINFPILKVVGSSRGLISVIDSTRNLFVFNPRTATCRTVSRKDEPSLNRSYSFGYKIEHGVSCHAITIIDDPPFHSVPSMSLFNLKANQWQWFTFDSVDWTFNLISDMAGAFMKGYFCWLGQVQKEDYVGVTGGLADSIIIFNGKKECFDFIPLPRRLIGSRVRLGNLGENIIALWEIGEKSSIWLINPDTKTFKQMPINKYASDTEFTPLCFAFKMACVLMLHNSNTMSLYSLMSQETAKVYNHQEECSMPTDFTHHKVQAICFRDTLLSPFDG